MKIENASLDAGQHGGPIAVTAYYKGDRYHIWIDRVTFEPSDETVYKKAPSQDRVRKLNSTMGAGAKIAPLLIAAARELMPAYLETIEEFRKNEKAEFAKRKRDWHAKEHGPELLAVLEAIVGNAGRTSHKPIGGNREEKAVVSLELIEAARVIIAKVEDSQL